MKQRLFPLAGIVLVGIVLVLTAMAGLPAPATAAPAGPVAPPAPPVPVQVTLEQSRLNTVQGTRLTVRANVTNAGTASTDRLVADLNVASLSGVYVDLEDWSASRTRELAPLAPGRTAALSWEIQAVNVGDFGVYVVVLPGGVTRPGGVTLPGGAATAGTGPLVVSPPLYVTVQSRRTLNAAGALPVVIVMPILLGLVAAATRVRNRRSN